MNFNYKYTTPGPLLLINQHPTVDLGGSLAVASRGLFATGVSTDLNVTYLSSGGQIGDVIRAEVTCDKCAYCYLFTFLHSPTSLPSSVVPVLKVHGYANTA